MEPSQPPPGYDRSRLAVVGASLSLFCTAGFLNAFGIFQEYYQTFLGESESNISWIGSISISIVYLCAPISGVLTDRLGPTILLCIGSIGQLFALFMTSLCKQYYQVFLAQGILLGVSMSLIFCPPVAVVSRRIPHRRGLALGLTIGGSSIGGIIWPILLEQLLNKRQLGFGWTMRVVAFTMAPLLAFACITVVDAPAPQASLSPIHAASDGDEKGTTSSNDEIQSKSKANYSILKNKTFILLCGGLALGYFGLFTPVFFVTGFGVQHGLSTSTAFYLLSGLNGASFLGRVIPGFLADRYGHFNLCMLATLAAGIVGFCWTAATSLPGLAVWSLAYGFSSGAIMSLQGACVGKIAHHRHQGLAVGFMMGSIAVTALVGPPISGQILAHAGYLALSMWTGATLVVGAAILAAARWRLNSSFHIAGASHAPLDPWSQGAGVVRDVLTRWSELDITQIGSLVAIAGTLPTAWRLMQCAWQEAYSCIRRFFLASVTIPGGDPVNRSVVKWVLANRPRHYRAFTGRTEVGRANPDRAAALKKSRHTVQYCPHWNTRWLWFKGNFFVVTRAVGDFNSSLSDPSYDGIGGEDLTISCFGWSAHPVQNLIEACREYADRQTQYFVIIYSRDRYGMSWKPKARKPLRHLDTVHFDLSLKQELLADIRNYLDPKTQMRYQSRSMPYRRGYLFYGPPGTGKSSLSVAIAGEFGLDLYEVKIPSVATDADLEQMFQEIPPRCVVLLEDIDAVWVERSSSHEKTSNGNGRGHSPESSNVPNCTLSGLLNVLDGVGSQEGRIVIMTTNRPEQLDSALIRPGRVDMKVLLGNISPKSAAEMFVRMFSPELGCTTHLKKEEIEKLSVQFSSVIPEDTLTPSQLQGFFQVHLESPYHAVESIASWVQKELARAHFKEFEFITSNGKA
ncbi:ATPase [Colletotrichum cuscutae]|uniref:ATPase n=1 Tax=Colletotrichum cuscutae TaxID=1209917 RepID=A0AAI9VGG8_9PEZI|nr:ATPase [Colletotrichum cuscutae]